MESVAERFEKIREERFKDVLLDAGLPEDHETLTLAAACLFFEGIDYALQCEDRKQLVQSCSAFISEKHDEALALVEKDEP